MRLSDVPVGSGSPLGIASGLIRDECFSVSSVWDPSHSATRCRLGVVDGISAWVGKSITAHEWIRVDLEDTFAITGVQTQGRADADGWVTQFTLWTSLDGRWFTQVPGPLPDGIFGANWDRNAIVAHRRFAPVTARYVQLRPVAWAHSAALRWELEGVRVVHVPSPEELDPLDTDTARQPVFVAAARPLGLSSGAIPDEAVSASSCFGGGDTHSPRRGRLHCVARNPDTDASAWCAGPNDTRQWWQVDLGALHAVTEIQMQGNETADQWTSRYRMLASQLPPGAPGARWTEVDAGRMLSFPGALDRHNVASNRLFTPFCARVVRILPVQWTGRVALRAEVLGRRIGAAREASVDAESENPTAGEL